MLKLICLSMVLCGLEAAATQVQEIRFTGNHKISSDRLKAQIRTREGTAFDPKLLDSDIQKLKSLYLNEGYAQAKITLNKNSDKEAVSININCKEGERYRTGEINFAGEWPKPPSDLLKSMRLRKQEIFNYQFLQDDLKQLQSQCGPSCYIVPRTRIREADREIDLVLEITKDL